MRSGSQQNYGTEEKMEYLLIMDLKKKNAKLRIDYYGLTAKNCANRNEFSYLCCSLWDIYI